MTGENEFNGYELSRRWFDFSYSNPEKIRPIHTALYFFIIDHCNRLGWKKKFSLPTEMAKEAIGVKNYKTYYQAFTDLQDFGFIEVIEKSKNQYSANIIAIVNFTKATGKALTKATLKQLAKQDRSTTIGNCQSTVYIDKPITLEPITRESNHAHNLQNSNLFRQPSIPTKKEVWEVFSRNGGTKEMAKAFYEKHEGLGWFLNGSPIVNFASLTASFIRNWQKNESNNPKKEINHEAAAAGIRLQEERAREILNS